MSNSNCHICQVNTGKYSCPKCSILYCSVECYRSESHSECSEAFYERWVKDELKNQDVEWESKKKMLEILKQQHCEIDSDESLDSDDSLEEPNLASRLLNLNLEDADVIWEKLTPLEKQEFNRLISSGEIMKIVPSWEPWWVTRKQKALIQDNENEFNFEEICPAILPEIPELSSLTKVEPSPSVAAILLNIVGAYACTVRWFKGTHFEMPVESISTCLAMSGALRANEIFKNPVEAFMSLQNDYKRCKWLMNDPFNGDLIHKDLNDIARGQWKGDIFFCIKAALSDLHSITTKAKESLQTSKTTHVKRFTGSEPNTKQLNVIKKKITYYLSWTVNHGSLFLNALNGFHLS